MRMWIGLGACQAVILYEPAFAVITRVYGPRYKQAILLMTFLGGLASTFGIPFAQLLIERIGWRPTPGGAGRDQPRRRPSDPLAVRSRPAGEARADRRGQAAGRRARRRRARWPAAVRVPAFWGLVVAFAGYGLAFSAMSFHLIPLLDDRGVPIGVVMAIIALIGPMQVVGRVLLMVGQRHITTIQLGAGIYFAFPDLDGDAGGWASATSTA